MFNRLVAYLEKVNILCENQFGFRNNHSAIHALILIADKLQKAIDKGNYTCGIFLDLSKAFDTVNHSILLKTLEAYFRSQRKSAKVLEYLPKFVVIPIFMF